MQKINGHAEPTQDYSALLARSIDQVSAPRQLKRTASESDESLMPKIMEDVLLAGDLARLSPKQRVEFYGSVCQSLGLNPLTKPFEYLQLNGKLILYAGKACAEQLRVQRGISVKITAREVIDSVYVVTAQAATRTGREDESTGAVPIASLNPSDRANAFMKAETKAKRRVTLSICGLGMMDECEVDSVRGAARVPVNYETGEILENTQAAADAVASRKLAELKARGEMLKTMKQMQSLIGSEEFARILAAHGCGSPKDIPDVAAGKVIWIEMESCRRHQCNQAYGEPQPVAEMSQYEDDEGGAQPWHQ